MKITGVAFIKSSSNDHMRYCLLIALLLQSTVFAMAGEEVWITPVGPDKTGSGTVGDPFVRSSEPSFDAKMSDGGIPANSIIHLMAGTFLTRGDVPLQQGWKLRGAGIDVTIIQMMPLPRYVTQYGSATNYEIRVLGMPPMGYSYSGMEVSDLTVDCNLQTQRLQQLAIGAVWIYGGDAKISRVKAINWGSENENIECCILGIAGGGPDHPATTNCLIEDCIVGQPARVNHKQGADGFVINGGPSNAGQSLLNTNGWVSGVEIRGCRMYNVPVVKGGGMGAPSYCIGISIGNGVDGARIDGNEEINVGGAAVYSSCGSIVNCSIVSNMFLNVLQGIYFCGTDSCGAGGTNFNSLKENVVIDNNYITVGTGGTGISMSGFERAYIRTLTIQNNVVHAGGGAGAVNGLAVMFTRGLAVRNNILDANGGKSLAIQPNTVSILQFHNNRTLRRAILTVPTRGVTNSSSFFNSTLLQ
jgi:hypothetical protein